MTFVLFAKSFVFMQSQIAWVTVRELVRERLIYNFFLFTILLIGLGMLASKLSFSEPDRVVLDFSSTGSHLTLLFTAIVAGSRLLSREKERKSIQVVLSKPIWFTTYISGRFIGLSIVLAANAFILFLVSLWVLKLVQLHPIGWLDFVSNQKVMTLNFVLMYVESLLLSGLTLFFTSFASASLSSIYSIGIYLIGSSLSQLDFLQRRVLDPILEKVLALISVGVPNFEYYHLGLRLTYSIGLPAKDVIYACVYAASWILTFLLATGYISRRKEF